jgi:hypothetical protein
LLSETCRRVGCERSALKVLTSPVTTIRPSVAEVAVGGQVVREPARVVLVEEEPGRC